jgi:hypothetical protein
MEENIINLPFPLSQKTQVLFSDGSDIVYKYLHYLTTPDSWYGIVSNLEDNCVLCNNCNCTIHIIKVFEKFDDEIICLFNFYLNDEDENELSDSDCSDEESDEESNTFNMNELENKLVELDSSSENSSDIDMDSLNETDLKIKEIIYSSDPVYNFEYIPLDNVREILTHRDLYEFAYDNDIFHYGFPENETIITNEDENKLELENDGEIWMRKLIN